MPTLLREDGFPRVAVAARPLHLGLGGERFFNRLLGAGADVGYLGVLASGESFGSGWVTFSPNFVARFPAKDKAKTTEPFVTVGYTMAIETGTESRDIDHGVNFGGGVNWWPEKGRMGLRIEVRDHVCPLAGRGAVFHAVGLRVGLTFR